MKEDRKMNAKERAEGVDKKRILFAGTPQIAVPLFERLCERFDVVGVLTSPDAPQGRSKVPVAPPVKEAALRHGIPVLQFDSLRTEAREAVSALKPQVLVTFAFGKIFGPRFLSLFEDGAFNVHPSRLPLLRGASPIQSTIINGYRECTISLQSLGLKMDEGDIWATRSFPLSGTETTESLTDLVSEEAAAFVPEALEAVFSSAIKAEEQKGEVSYCSKIEREESHLDFNRPALEIHCLIRAMYPWPKAFALCDGKEIFVTGVWGGYGDLDKESPLESSVKPGTVVAYRKDRGVGVACSDKVIWLNSFQLPARKEMDFKAFANGNPWIKTAVFN